MQDGVDIRAAAVNGGMEREFRRRLMDSLTGAVRFNADDIGTGQGPFINPGRRNPDVPLSVLDRQVAAGGRRHASRVNSVHDHHQLVGRVQVLEIHIYALLILLTPSLSFILILRKPPVNRQSGPGAAAYRTDRLTSKAFGLSTGKRASKLHDCAFA